MLIICPECNNHVSDKAEICPHCGIKIAGNVTIQPVQPATIQATPVTPVQPVTPIQPVPAQPIQGTNPSGNEDNKKEKKSSHKGLVISFIIAIIICGIGYYFYNDAQQLKEQEAYEYALQSDDPLVLQNFLSKYMDAPKEHRDSINARLNSLQQEDLDWQNAVNSGSRGELLKYIEHNPSSPHLAEAKNMVDSIDYFKADRNYKNNKDIAALQEYLQNHPEGRYASLVLGIIEDLQAVNVSPEDIAKAREVCKKFFQAINSHNESKLLGTVTDFLASFLNRTGASNDDVVTFMNKLYKDDITNMNWHILDDFKAEKVDNGDGGKNIKVQFGAEQRIERTDPTKEKYGKYIISAEVTPDWRITKFNMKKVSSKEE